MSLLGGKRVEDVDIGWVCGGCEMMSGLGEASHLGILLDYMKVHQRVDKLREVAFWIGSTKETDVDTKIQTSKFVYKTSTQMKKLFI